jgi:hypothetical protein
MSEYAAVIVETRNIPNLKSIIDKHMRMLDNRWELYIFHHLNDSAFDGLKATKINLHKNLDKDSYSGMLATEDFWNQIPHEKILIFQHDSMLLRRGIDKFLEWDWIGAPSDLPSTGSHYNGGLSLRSRTKMIEVIKNYRYSGEYEDVYFHNGMRSMNANIATEEVAKEFCCEKYFKLGTLGYHGLHYFHSPEQISLIKEQYFGEGEL